MLSFARKIMAYLLVEECNLSTNFFFKKYFYEHMALQDCLLAVECTIWKCARRIMGLNFVEFAELYKFARRIMPRRPKNNG